MGETKIEWTATKCSKCGKSYPGFTFNPWRGCTKISPACTHCYADTLSARNPKTLGVWGKNGTRPIAAESYWKLPEKWNRVAEQTGLRRKVFCASLADVFEGEDTMPAEAWFGVQQARGRLFSLIERTPNLDWLLLTKRPENVTSLAPFEWEDDGWPPNVWIGTTVENQQYADERIPHLLTIPAKVRFLSCEPLLGPIDLSEGGHGWLYVDELANGRRAKIHWVIAGGESGSNARSTHPNWYRSLRDQCLAASVPFHFKQWGEFGILPGTVDGTYRVGKKAAGRVLDGRTWDEMPEVSNG